MADAAKIRPGDKNSISIEMGINGDIETMERDTYRGRLTLLPADEAGIALCNWAKEMVEEAYSPLDPQTAQHHLNVDEFVEIAARLKPDFIHSPKTRVLQKQYLTALGFDPERTYIDVPRMRVVTSDGYLAAGVGHKQPPHRDTWWSAPFQQIQFWMPLFPMTRECSMEFYPHYSEEGVPNSSSDFNIYRWNATGRKNASKHRGKEDKRGIPVPKGPLEHPGACQIVLPVGGAVMFSANQLHATSDNITGKTRFSIDFRIVDAEHVKSGIGAKNVDNASTGTALRDFRRLSDDAHMPEEWVKPYDLGPDVEDGVKVFAPAE